MQSGEAGAAETDDMDSILHFRGLVYLVVGVEAVSRPQQMVM